MADTLGQDEPRSSYADERRELKHAAGVHGSELPEPPVETQEWLPPGINRAAWDAGMFCPGDRRAIRAMPGIDAAYVEGRRCDTPPRIYEVPFLGREACAELVSSFSTQTLVPAMKPHGAEDVAATFQQVLWNVASFRGALSRRFAEAARFYGLQPPTLLPSAVLVKYEPGAALSWHTDNINPHPQFRFGATIVLDDEHEEGDLLIQNPRRPDCWRAGSRVVGTLSIFPATYWHRVTRVKRAARFAAVLHAQ